MRLPMMLAMATIASMAAKRDEDDTPAPTKPITATSSGNYRVTLSEDPTDFVVRVVARQERERARQRVEAAREKQKRKGMKRALEAARREAKR